jgi:hypothetical protein
MVEEDPSRPVSPDTSINRASVRCFAGSDHRLVLKEGGLCDYYSICLSSKPTSSVEIYVEKGQADLEIDPVKLIIEPDTWDDVKTIKVRAVDHPGSDGFSWTTDISHVVKSNDSRYQSPRCSIVPNQILITVMENDAPYMLSFGDSEFGQTGLNHLNLQPIPKLVDFRKAMNKPLDIHESLSDRNTNRKKDTTRPWHQTKRVGGGGKKKRSSSISSMNSTNVVNSDMSAHRPKINRPTKTSTSLMLRRILQQKSSDESFISDALTASEVIAKRRTASIKKNDMNAPGVRTYPKNDPQVEKQLLKSLFPNHKTLDDHQNIEKNERNRLFQRKKRLNFTMIHNKKLNMLNEKMNVYNGESPPPTHISVLSCGMDHNGLVTGNGKL